MVLFANFVNALLYIILIAMFGRVILTWLFPDEDTKIGEFLYMVPEPLLTPIRRLLSRFDFFSNLPFDVSVIVFMLIVSFIQMLLPVLSY